MARPYERTISISEANIPDDLPLPHLHEILNLLKTRDFQDRMTDAWLRTRDAEMEQDKITNWKTKRLLELQKMTVEQLISIHKKALNVQNGAPWSLSLPSDAISLDVKELLIQDIQKRERPPWDVLNRY